MLLNNAGSQIVLTTSSTYSAIIVGQAEVELVRKHILLLSTFTQAFTFPLQSEALVVSGHRNAMACKTPVQPSKHGNEQLTRQFIACYNVPTST